MLQIETVLMEKNIHKKNLKHQKQHDKKSEHHKKKKHNKEMYVNESLMDVIPLTHEEKGIFENKGALAPVDFGME